MEHTIKTKLLCEKTISGKHLWQRKTASYNSWDSSEAKKIVYKVCLACGLIDDREAK